MGRAGVANARLAYKQYQEVFVTRRARQLMTAGARPQRPLWASTGVKDPAYPDTMYVSELVAPDLVNTMPEATLDAVADHGVIGNDTIRGNYAYAQQVLDDLAAVGIDYNDVVALLEEDGVAKFEASWTRVADQLTDRLRAGQATLANHTSPHMLPVAQEAVAP